jgi:hypothetical protein
MALAAAMFVVHALSAVAPATAGGSWLSPVRDRYEPGEVATLVGYTSGGQLGWVQDGPFFAYLVAGDLTLWAEHRLPTDHVALGPLSIQARGRTLRVSISFPVPGHLVAGLYTVTYCNDPCTTGLGDLIGGSVALGVDPPRKVQRAWDLDDPEIANLADDAVLAGPGDSVTAADVRAGRAVAPAQRPSAGQPLGPDERPAPPPVAELQADVPPVVTAAPAAAPLPAVPDQSKGRPLGILLVLATVLLAGGAASLHRRRRASRQSVGAWRPRDRQTPADERTPLPSRPPARVGGGE